MTVKTFRVVNMELALSLFTAAGFKAAVTGDKVGFAGGCSDPGCCMQPSGSLTTIKVEATCKEIEEVMREYHFKMAALVAATTQMKEVERVANEGDPDPEELEHMKGEMEALDREIRALENQ